MGYELDYGLWVCLGLCVMGYGSWVMGYGIWVMGNGAWILGSGLDYGLGLRLGYPV